MNEGDVDIRNRTYAAFVELGRAPSPVEVGDPAEVVAAWRRLHDAHAIVLNPATDELRMLNPFSVAPSAHRVHARDRWWYANCAWDAFGVCAALGADGRIETSCPDCGSRWSSRCGTSARTTRACSFTASCRRRTGGTTSSSPEPR